MTITQQRQATGAPSAWHRMRLWALAHAIDDLYQGLVPSVVPYSCLTGTTATSPRPSPRTALMLTTHHSLVNLVMELPGAGPDSRRERQESGRWSGSWTMGAVPTRALGSAPWGGRMSGSWTTSAAAPAAVAAGLTAGLGPGA